MTCHCPLSFLPSVLPSTESTPQHVTRDCWTTTLMTVCRLTNATSPLAYVSKQIASRSARSPPSGHGLWRCNCQGQPRIRLASSLRPGGCPAPVAGLPEDDRGDCPHLSANPSPYRTPRTGVQRTRAPAVYQPLALCPPPGSLCRGHLIPLAYLPPNPATTRPSGLTGMSVPGIIKPAKY